MAGTGGRTGEGDLFGPPGDRLKQWTCGHSAQTFIDERGQTVCTDCGALIQARLTPEFFREAMDAAFRSLR